jgi:flavin-dependent dehydrogenase
LQTLFQTPMRPRVLLFDALIVGGGPAGATVASLLARAGWSVVLIEKASFPRRKVCGEFISAPSLPLLRLLGLHDRFLELAGPPVREVGLYAGRHMLTAPMPVNRAQAPGWGHALGREHLDELILAVATKAGVTVMQPCTAIGLVRKHGIFICTVKQDGDMANKDVRARVVIAAHGSWEKGKLPTQTKKRKPHPSDLLAFKAHFTATRLPKGLMPLLAFPGGYGGMVHTDQGRTSLSCCIRRDILQQCRAEPDMPHRAADAVCNHLMKNCLGVQRALKGTETLSSWLSAGPIRPGVHTLYNDGIFVVGNAAGEAHPVIAEGISMAMQGAWLLAGLLIEGRAQVLAGDTGAIGHTYIKTWRRHFVPRLRMSWIFAHLAMRPVTTQMLLPLYRHVPKLLTFCTRISGKTVDIIPASS